MAIVEVSEDGVRRAAGGEVFGQAKEWADKVSGLRAGGPVISATVDGVPVSARMLPDGIAGECPMPGGRAVRARGCRRAGLGTDMDGRGRAGPHRGNAGAGPCGARLLDMACLPR